MGYEHFGRTFRRSSQQLYMQIQSVLDNSNLSPDKRLRSFEDNFDMWQIHREDQDTHDLQLIALFALHHSIYGGSNFLSRLVTPTLNVHEESKLVRIDYVVCPCPFCHMPKPSNQNLHRVTSVFKINSYDTRTIIYIFYWFSEKLHELSCLHY